MTVDEHPPVSKANPSRRGHGPRRRRWLRNLLLVAGAAAVALAIVIVVLVHVLNTPATVPPSWQPPTELPKSASPVPPGDLVFDSNRTGNFEIWTMTSTGDDEHQLTNDPVYDSWWPRLSPDRRTILFYRAPKGVHDRDYSKTSLWAIAADGGRPVELRPAGLDGWVVQGHAEWSPDGAKLVMFGGSRFSSQIFVTDDLGQHPRAVTDRPGANVDPSWSPDGRFIVFSGCPGSPCLPSDHEIYDISVSGGTATRLTHDHIEDNDPYFSPDGHELAWLSKMSGGLLSAGTWDIRILPVVEGTAGYQAAAGAHPRLVVPLHTGDVNGKPTWSSDGRTIYFQRAVGGLANGYQIWAVNPDGTDLREVTRGQPGWNEYPGT